MRAWVRHAQRRRREALALAVLAGLALIFFWPVTLGLAWIPRGGGDLASFLWPTYAYAARSLWSGRVPLWNETLYSGMPFAADNQSGLFYPLNLLAFLIAPSFPYHAIEWLVVFHIWLAGASLYALLRCLLPPSSGRIPALFAAIAFMFSDVLVTHIGNLNIIAVAAWLPAALAGLHLSLQRRSVNWALAAGLALGVAALAGHAQMLLLSAGALGLLALWQMVGSGLQVARASSAQPIAVFIRHVLPRLGLTAIVFLIAFGLSAVAVIPALELTAHTARARLTYAEAAQYSLPWAGLAGLFSPLVFGRGAVDFWAPWPRVELGYLGVLPLVFAGLAPLRGKNRMPLFMLALAILGVLVALGENTPVHRLLYAVVPGFAQLRVPARWVLLTDLALAVLAGYGLHHVLIGESDARWRRRWVLGLGALALVVVPLANQSAAVDNRPVLNLWLSLGVILALLAAGYVLITITALRPLVPALSLALVAVDLIGHGAWVEVDWNDPTLGFQRTVAAAFLKAQPGPTRMDAATGAWAPDAAALHGLEDIGGISNPLGLAAYQTYVGAMGPRGSPLYSFLNAQFIVAEKDRAPGDASLVPVFNEDPNVDVYLNTNAMPRVSLIYSAVAVADGEAAFAAIHAPTFDPARQVVIEDGPPLAASAPEAGSNLYYLRYAPESFSVVAVTPAPAYLVFSEVWYPGWRAQVDEVEVPIYRANFTFRAVRLEPGEHTVTMWFDPLSFKLGLGLTLLTLVVCALRLAIKFRPKAPVTHEPTH